MDVQGTDQSVCDKAGFLDCFVCMAHNLCLHRQCFGKRRIVSFLGLYSQFFCQRFFQNRTGRENSASGFFDSFLSFVKRRESGDMEDVFQKRKFFSICLALKGRASFYKWQGLKITPAILFLVVSRHNKRNRKSFALETTSQVVYY